MSRVRIVCAILLAVPLIVFGGNYFIQLFELPPADDSAGQQLLESMRDGGLMAFIAASHVIVGVMLLIPAVRFAAALVQLPLSLGITAFHATMLPEGLGLAVAMLVLNLGVLADKSRIHALVAAPGTTDEFD